MKCILIFSTLLATAYAGVGVVTPEIEAQALKLWAQYCNGNSDGGQDGNTLIYCKRALGKGKQTLKHEVSVGSGPAGGEQIVFVQPPSYHYKHEVRVTGGAVNARKTVIYVKPAKNTHEVSIQDQTDKESAPQKPTLFFLKGNHGPESASESSGGEVTPPPATYLPPQNTYLPPSSTEGYNYPPPSVQLEY